MGGLAQWAYNRGQEGQSCACDHWHTFLPREDNVLAVCAILYNSLLYSSALKSTRWHSEFASYKPKLCDFWVGQIFALLTIFVTTLCIFQTFQAFLRKVCLIQTSAFHSIPGRSEHLLSETSAVDLGDGIWSHGTSDARAGGRTLGHWGDAVRRVLTGWGKGCVAGHAQTIFCFTKSKAQVQMRNFFFF